MPGTVYNKTSTTNTSSMINFGLGFIAGWLSLMILRWVLYRINKTAMDIQLKNLEDAELLKQYKDNG